MDATSDGFDVLADGVADGDTVLLLGALVGLDVVGDREVLLDGTKVGG